MKDDVNSCVYMFMISAIMHLYYARFFNHFLYDAGLVPTKEPFINLLTQGMVMGRSYRLKDSGKYIAPSEVDTSGKYTPPSHVMYQVNTHLQAT